MQVEIKRAVKKEEMGGSGGAAYGGGAGGGYGGECRACFCFCLLVLADLCMQTSTDPVES